MSVINGKLLGRFLDNDCSPEEAKEVLNWFNTIEGHSQLNAQIEKDIVLFESDDVNNTNQTIRSDYMYDNIIKKINSNEEKTRTNIRRVTLFWTKIAATILIPLLLATSIFWIMSKKSKNNIEWQEVYVPRGEKLQIMFQDGTKVWLNSDTRLKYPINFQDNQRKVQIEGEAYFIVKKNPNKPFLVQLNDITIKVTGTSFNVKAYKDDLEIIASLDEGKIYFQTKGKTTGNEYLVKPGQQALYSKESKMVFMKVFEASKNSIWRNNEILFHDTPLAEVIKVLERWYNVKFEMDSTSMPNYSYTISFRNETLQNVLLGLSKITPLDFKNVNGIIKIKKKQNYK